MISFFRRALSSWIVLGLFGLILISFLVTGMFTGGTGGIGQLASHGDTISKVGGFRLTVADASARANAQVDSIRQQQPEIDMAQFVRSGSLDEMIEQIVNGKAFEEFGRRTGMAISKRSVDAEINTIGAFKGPTGKFDPQLFRQALQERKLTEAMLRDDIASSKMVEMMATPIAGGSRPPGSLVMPYASLRLERRSGQIVFVPAAPGGPPPSEAELTTFYQANTQRYIVPETRVIRYATFDRSRFPAQTATEAELAAAYKARAGEFAAKERRTFGQVIVPAQVTAAKIAAAARAGTALSAAARANGGEATALAPQEQAAFAGLSSPQVAQAAFTAQQKAVVGPLKSPLGWHVIVVDKIDRIGGKTLADVRGTLSAEIIRRKQEEVASEYVAKLDDAIAEGATFDEVVGREKFTVVTTPAVTASGIAPADPGYKAPENLARLLRDAFLGATDDDPAIETLVPGQMFALYKLDRVNPSAPRPLAAIRQQVTADFMADRASKAARRTADALAANANKGTPIAVAAASARANAPRPVSARRIDLELSQERVAPELALMFAMPAKRAKVLAAPNKTGWNVIWLDSIIAGDARTEPGLVRRTQDELGRAAGEEYVKQFAAAIRAELGVSKNKDAVAALKKSLTGSQGQ